MRAPKKFTAHSVKATGWGYHAVVVEIDRFAYVYVRHAGWSLTSETAERRAVRWIEARQARVAYLTEQLRRKRAPRPEAGPE
jgi:hypothetical protein